jgi:hypothetical protein
VERFVWKVAKQWHNVAMAEALEQTDLTLDSLRLNVIFPPFEEF